MHANFFSAGVLDKSFSNDGEIRLLVGSYGCGGNVTVQPNGKILIDGYYENSNKLNDLLVVRLNKDGTLDKTFSGNGAAKADFSGFNAAANAIVVQTDVIIQPDGKIIAAGQAQENGVNFAIARYNTDGSPDASFGGDGIVITPVGTGISSAAGYGATIQPDGKILQPGFYYTSQHKDAFVVIRYNTTGSLDNSFAGNGKAPIVFDGNTEASSIVLQSNGEIIVAGSATDASLKSNVALARLKTNGSIDNSFGTNGKVITDFSGDDHGNACVLQKDGKVIITGMRTLQNKNIIIAARYITASSFASTIIDNVSDNKAVEELNIKVYPNPVSDILHIDGLTSSALLIITDVSGNVLLKQNIKSADESINIKSLREGSYTLTIIKNGRFQIKNFSNNNLCG